MKSLGAMILQLVGMYGTQDLTEWETKFIRSIGERTQNGGSTTTLTAKQVEVVENIYRKHFGDAE